MLNFIRNTKVLVILSLVFVFILGINYRPQVEYDYSQVKALDEGQF